MLRRANIALFCAAAPGFLALTGWIDLLTPAARVLALALLGFSIVSFLLALFEDEDVPKTVPDHAIDNLQPAPMALNEPKVAKVAP